MYASWTWIRIWVPERKDSRKMWLKIGEILERFAIYLTQYQYLVGEGNEDIELEGDAVSWEAIFDWTSSHSNGLFFFARLTCPDLEWCEAEISLSNSRRGSLDVFCEMEPPLESGWAITLGISYTTIKMSGRAFFDRLMTLSKALFLEFNGIYGVIGEDEGAPGKDYASMEFAKLMREGVLRSIPIVLRPLPDNPKWIPIWFYLLNKERYEASKPYLSSLPIKRVEELPNGGALLFVGYPFIFEK